MRRAPWLAVLASGAAWSGPLHAEDEPVLAELAWQGGPSGSNCIDAQGLGAAVEARLGRKLFAPGRADVRVAGAVTQDSGKWLVRITLTSAAGEPMGERDLESASSDCSALDDSLALVLAVMLDIPKTRIPEPAPAPIAGEPPKPRAPARPPPASKLRLPEDTAPRRPRWRFELGLGALGVYGLLPEFSYGLRGHFAVKPPEFWKVGVDVGTYASVDESIGSIDAGASFSPKELGVFVCPLDLPLSTFLLEGCVVQHMGRLRVEGFGFDTNEEQERPYVNLGVAFAGGLQIVGPLSVRVGVDAQTPLLRETFRYGSQDGEEPSLFRMAPVLVTGQIGAVAHF